MVKKRNKTTRKKYKKGGDKVKECNDRLEEKFPNKGFVWKRRKCSENPDFGKDTQKPSKSSIKDRASALEKQFSTHDPNHPLCHDTSNFPLSDKEVNIIYNYLHKREEKVESKKCGDYKAKECPSDECMLEPKKSAMERLNIKNQKKLKRSMRKCLSKKTGGKRKKRKKSRKRRR